MDDEQANGILDALCRDFVVQRRGVWSGPDFDTLVQTVRAIPELHRVARDDIGLRVERYRRVQFTGYDEESGRMELSEYLVRLSGQIHEIDALFSAVRGLRTETPSRHDAGHPIDELMMLGVPPANRVGVITDLMHGCGTLADDVAELKRRVRRWQIISLGLLCLLVGALLVVLLS